MDEQKFRDDFAKLKADEKKIRAGRPDPNDSLANEAPAKSRAMAYSLLGFEFAAIFFGFVWASSKADKYLGTGPWLTLVGISSGFSLALYRLIFVARKLSEEK